MNVAACIATLLRFIPVALVVSAFPVAKGILLQSPSQRDQDSGHKTASQSLCVQGRLVPQLYLLGAPKCGTTSLASDLRRAGIRSNAEPEKELHFWNTMAMRHLSLCDVPPKMINSWLNLHPPCPTEGFQVLGDYTPDNARLTSPPSGWRINTVNMVWSDNPFLTTDMGKACLPTILHDQLYLKSSSRLTFVFMIREPLSRVLSAFYFRNAVLLRKNHVEDQVEASMQRRVSAMRQGVYDQPVWSSMYARQLEQYLDKFKATQFIIVPYLHYFQHKCTLFHDLSLRLGIPLPCQDANQTTRIYPDSQKDAQVESRTQALSTQVLSSTTRKEFESVMEPEVERLVTLLANVSLRGLGLHAYNGTLGSEDETRTWLFDGWR